MVAITPFGGCILHNPLGEYYKKNRAVGMFSKMGFRNTPFSLSANTNHQLIDFLTGSIDIPQWIQSLAYSDGFIQPTAEHGRQIFSGEVALVEMSTPTEYTFEGVLLNINRFEEIILLGLGEYFSERKLIGKWKGALRRAKEDVRQVLAEDIYNSISKDTPERQNIAKFVRETSSRMLSVEEMTKSMADLRDRLGIPVALMLHNFNYMPDGRPVSWPAEFKDNSIEVARRLDIPTLDFAAFVQTEGVGRVLADDRRHWRPSAYAEVGELIHDFCEGIIDRPTFAGSSTPLAKRNGSDATRAAFVPAQAVSVPLDSPTPAPVVQRPASGPGPAASRVEFAPRQMLAEPRSYQFDAGSGGQLPEAESTVFAVIVLGGAWANGANSDVEDKVVSADPEHPSKALMFDTGVRPRGREARVFVDLRERGGGSAKETPCAGIADQVIRNCQTRFGDKPSLLLFSVSRGGTSLSGRGMTDEDGLLRGSSQHREVVRLVAPAREIAMDRGLRLEVAAICLLHGEYEAGRNVPGSAYRRSVSRLQLQYDADIRALTGQADPVRLYLTQTNRVSNRFDLEIPMAQLNAKYDNPNVQCVGPVYFATPEVREGGPAAYVSAYGYRRIGQLFGRFLLDDMWGANRDPLRVEEARWVGPKTIRLRYNNPIALEEDDARVNISELGPGRGVDFNDGAPWSPTVESVQPVRGRDFELDVELTAPSTGYAKRLYIAARPTGRGGVGCLEGARSGIRSKDAFDTDPLDGTELFDWACTEVISLP